jgi:hypothetical protein
VSVCLEEVDTAASTNWALGDRPFRGSAGVDTEVDMDSERHDARVEF